MRRSAAPSQKGQTFKRPRFMPPLLKNETPTEEHQQSPLDCSGDEAITQGAISRTCRDDTKDGDSQKSSRCNDDLDLSGIPHWEPISSNHSKSEKCVNKESDLRLQYLKQEQITNHKSADDVYDERLSKGNINTLENAEVKVSSISQQTESSDNTHWNHGESISVNSSDGDITGESVGANTTKTAIQISCGSARPRFKPFKTPSLQTRTPLTPKSSLPTNSAVPPQHSVSPTSLDNTVERYFSVMWCKLSKKKHKKWEGDAILVAKGKSVTLIDMEGKMIGKAAGYKISELASLQEGQTLAIGGKEIEVMGVMSAENYRKGLCFQGATKPSSPPTRPTATFKPFAKPLKPGNSFNDRLHGTSDSPAAQMIKPRHDPTAPGALVLPRPGQAHQWENNRNKLSIVDVVVDPYISQHLRPHQRDGVVFLYECALGLRSYSGQGAILADEMGLGKTLQCISLIWTLLRQGPYGGKPLAKRILIITPGSLVKNWSREFKKWLGTERLKIFAVGPDNKVEEFISSTVYPVLIISYEMFVRTVDIIQQVKYDLIVCDEGHRLKNSNIKTTSYVNSLSTRRRVVLTGTPVQNDLQELFAIVDFCNPGILGTSSGFRHVFEEPILGSRRPSASIAERDLGESRAAELNRLTAMFILRRTCEVNNKYLPPKVELVLFCQPSNLQVTLYRHLINSRIVRSCFSSSTDSAQHLMCISALKKLCNHPSLIYKNALECTEKGGNQEDDAEGLLYKGLIHLYPSGFNPDEVGQDHSGKLAVLATLLRSMHSAIPQQRVVLVSNYTQTLNVLELLCKAESYSFLRLDGQTPTSKRQQLVERFNSQYSNDFVFLLSSKAGGVGLNLIGASRLILYDIDWNPANDLQAMARVWRDGQRQRVYIYRLLTTGTLEEKMYQRQVSKQGLSGVVVDAKTNTKLHFSPEELKDLFLLQENTLCGTHELLNCNCQRTELKESCETTMSRNCQLQVTSANSSKQDKRNKCMSELMEWHHEYGPAPPLSLVDSIVNEEELEGVTFAFWNENNSVPS